MSETYLIDRQRREARRRHALLAKLDDPWTIAQLEEIGVEPGWRCLEVGAGAGSIAVWLCDRVGPDGSVVATDLDTGFLDELDPSNLEVRRHDVVADELEEGEFDLVHERAVLLHVSRPEEALAKLVRAVRPGGWILLEEPDGSFDGPDPASSAESAALYRKVTGAIFDFVGEQGIDLGFPARMPGLLAAHGVDEFRCAGHLHFFRGATEPRSAHMPAFAELAGPVVESGAVTESEYRSFLALENDPAFAWREAMMVSARGRRKAGGSSSG